MIVPILSGGEEGVVKMKTTLEKFSTKFEERRKKREEKKRLNRPKTRRLDEV